MNKLKITLKWRFTLLTIFLIVLSSGAITLAINRDIGRSIPMTPSNIVGESDNLYISFDVEELIQAQEPSSSIPSNKANIISPGQFEIAMTTAVSNIYTTSIITLIIIIFLGGISAYFVAGRALSPIKDLSDNIKSINENNLLSNLEVEGPRDEIKELTISFNQMLAKLNHAFTSQKRFNASIAHELKTPLAVMKTNIDVLNEYEEKTVEMYQETIEVVRDSVCKLNSMIETMLDLVRQENAPLDDTVDINQIIEDVVEDLMVIAKEKEITLDYHISENHAPIKGNEILLYRAIYNVVENGIKYNLPYGQVNIQSVQTKESIEIRIQDTGKGMRKEEVNRIFEPFYRIDKFNQAPNSGLGLGLALTQSTVAIHGGEIKVESKVDEGTRFSIRLPIHL